MPDPTPRPNYLLAGFTASYDKATNRLFERHLHAEPRSHLYPADKHDSANRLQQYHRGVLDGAANPPGSVIETDGEIQLIGTDTERTYNLDLVGNWGDSDTSEVAAVTYKPAGEDPPITETVLRKRNNLNQIDSQDGTSFSHDANGNLTDDGTLTYKYDAFNRLREVRRKADSSLIAKYVYDAQGRRVRKVVSNGGVDNNPAVDGTTDYLYSGSRCMEERDGSDNVLRQYVWGRYIDGLIQQREYDPADETRFNDFYPISDLHHRSAALTNEDGCIVETYDTDAYGRTLIFGDCRDGAWFTRWDRSLQKVGPEDPPREVPFNPLCPFIYTGRRYDSETSLYFYRARYYSPDLGRFIGRDPKDYIEGMGLYQYTMSNPIIGLDPDGTSMILESTFAAEEETSSTIPAGAIGLSAVMGSNSWHASQRVPLGFSDFYDFRDFGKNFYEGLYGSSGVTDATLGIRGSSVTHRSFSRGISVTAETMRDFDFAIISDDLISRARDMGMPMRGPGKLGTRTKPMTGYGHWKLGGLELAAFHQDLSLEMPKPLSFMIYQDIDSLAQRGDYIALPQLKVFTSYGLDYGSKGLGVAGAGWDAYEIMSSDDPLKTTKVKAGGWAGSVALAPVGAAIGFYIAGPIGAGVGTLVFGIAGAVAGEEAAESVVNTPFPKQRPYEPAKFYIGNQEYIRCY